MAKLRERVKTTARRAGGRRPAERARAATTAAPVETLSEQADRLGLLDPLDEEPAHVFYAGLANESES
jgi:hypothetical protein